MSLLSKLTKFLGPQTTETPEKIKEQFKFSLSMIFLMILPLCIFIFNDVWSDARYFVLLPLITIALWSYKAYLYSDSHQAKSNKNTETPAL